MTTSLDGKDSGAEHTPLAVFTHGAHGTTTVPVPEQEFDDVLPNLLLDVREAFLADFRSVFRRFGVTDQQFRVLNILYLSGDLEIGRLARRSRIVAPSMTGILNRMVEIGWVARKASKGQRWGRVSLTAEGRRLIKQLMPPVEERLAAIEAALGAHDLETLADLLAKARTVLRGLVKESRETTSTDKRRVPRKRSIKKRRGTQRNLSGSHPKNKRQSLR
jgi:homoprotocatechuate degradation regulator HpaR